MTSTVSVPYPLQPHRFRPTDRNAQRQMFRNGIRTMRATPPGMAGEDLDRARVCRAAIAQFEELLDAAAGSSPASQPLMLYYAISQAGRAIAAAWHDESEHWAFSGHGLTCGDLDAGVLRHTIKPKPTKDGRDAFSVMSQTLKSGIPSGAVSVEQVWMTHPDLSPIPLPNSEHPPAIPVHVLNGNWDAPQNSYAGKGLAGLKPPTTRVSVALLASEYPHSYEELLPALGAYPGGTSATAPAMQGAERMGVITTWAADTPHAIVEWDAASTDEADKKLLLDDIAPLYRFVDRRWLVPFVEGARVTPFMLWWMLLYGLSMSARYEPGEWVEAGRIDSSPLAVHIEDGLRVAIEALPQLVYEELARDRHLVAPS